MKNYKKWIAIGLWIIAVWLFIYFLIPHVKFWTLYGLDYSQKDKFHTVAENQTYMENYQMYKETYRAKQVDDYLIDRLMLDRAAIQKHGEDFSEWRNEFIKDYGLEYYYNRYLEKGDKRIFEEIEKAIQTQHN